MLPATARDAWFLEGLPLLAVQNLLSPGAQNKRTNRVSFKPAAFLPEERSTKLLKLLQWQWLQPIEEDAKTQITIGDGEEGDAINESAHKSLSNSTVLFGIHEIRLSTVFGASGRDSTDLTGGWL
jgi:hypothetical protein